MVRRSAAAVLIAVFCACGTPAPAFKAPPAGSFVSATHQVKIAGDTASLQGAAITPEFFPAIGVQPLLGRFFISGDFAAAGPSTVVLSHQMWNARLGASATVIGQQIEIDGRPSVIVGIAPPGFDAPQGAQFWMPKK